VPLRHLRSSPLGGIAALADAKIVSTPVRDYPWRVHVSREMFQQWLSASAVDMQYGNFKNRIHETRGDEFHSALSRVWDVMHDVEERGE